MNSSRSGEDPVIVGLPDLARFLQYLLLFFIGSGSGIYHRIHFRPTALPLILITIHTILKVKSKNDGS